MIRVLLIARYRDLTMFRKVEALVRMDELSIRTVVPVHWQDLFFQVEQTDQRSSQDERIALPMLNSPTDPHRSLYRTLTFGARTFHPQIIHAEEEPDSLAALQVALARRLWAPQAKLLLHTWQNVDRPKGAHVRTVLHLTLSAADGIFCANQEAAVLLRRWGYTRPTPIIPAIGVDTETFRPCPQVQRDRFVVGYIGRLVPEKGIDTLIDAFARLRTQQSKRPLRLEIVGAGPAETMLTTQVRQLGLQDAVHFVQPMPPAQVARKLCDLDVLVLPSRTASVWKEQLGRVLLEAMASKVPVIGSDSGAIPEVIGDAGLLFPEDDTEALTECLDKLLCDLELRETLADRGYRRIQERYTQIALAHQTADFYRQILR